MVVLCSAVLQHLQPEYHGKVILRKPFLCCHWRIQHERFANKHLNKAVSFGNKYFKFKISKVFRICTSRLTKNLFMTYDWRSPWGIWSSLLTNQIWGKMFVVYLMTINSPWFSMAFVSFVASPHPNLGRKPCLKLKIYVKPTSKFLSFFLFHIFV